MVMRNLMLVTVWAIISTGVFEEKGNGQGEECLSND